ncbi:MAG: hypothetical protein M1831_000060 [Alyxoria varia]|nr:MAG: hypothetical protein M1831_000060 [Alyxoria varia]
MGYKPKMFYPKQSKNELYQRLVTQLQNLSIPFVDDFSASLKDSDYVLDSIFGFSFTGSIRDPFPPVIEALAHSPIPVLAVDSPSSWNIEEGPPKEGPGKDYNPAALISLTAPKPLVGWFRGRHFVGGRFLPTGTAAKYGLDIPSYQGVDQIVEVPTGGEGRKL